MENKLQNKMLLLIISFSLIAAMIAASGIVFASASTPTVWTDKDDYAPGETVVITGTGFPANKKLIVQIIRPQGSDMLPVKTDGSGSFTLEYKLTKKRAMDGTYQVLVIDPVTGDVLAATTFTDAGDESFWGYNLESNVWTHGNLGKDYYEGDWVSYQLVISRVIGLLISCREKSGDDLAPAEIESGLEAEFVKFWRNTGHEPPGDMEITAAKGDDGAVSVSVAMTPPDEVLPSRQKIDFQFGW